MSNPEDQAAARAAAAEILGRREPFPVKEDTGDYFRIQAGDIVNLAGVYYLVRGEASEGRFGLDGEPKFWVKRAQELPSGRRVIIKLVFLEDFEARIGPLTFKCFRSPEKEGRILDKVRGHPGFMQGRSVKDAAGNNVRILDIVPGPTLDAAVRKVAAGHEEYYRGRFRELFPKFIQAVEDMAHLHSLGEIHGDIRRDHLILDRNTGRLVWIDFDYTFDYRRANRLAYDLFGLGNSIQFLVGQGVWTLQQLARDGYNDLLDKLDTGDMNIVFKNNLANLKKLFPYIDEELNNICLHFANRAGRFYETTTELLADLNRVAERCC